MGLSIVSLNKAPQAALGVLAYAQKHLNVELKESWSGVPSRSLGEKQDSAGGSGGAFRVSFNATAGFNSQLRFPQRTKSKATTGHRWSLLNCFVNTGTRNCTVTRTHSTRSHTPSFWLARFRRRAFSSDGIMQMYRAAWKVDGSPTVSFRPICGCKLRLLYLRALQRTQLCSQLCCSSPCRRLFDEGLDVQNASNFASMKYVHFNN